MEEKSKKKTELKKKMLQPVEWFVISNRSEAVIYKEAKNHEKFNFVQRLENPEGKLMEGELDSDKAGSVSSSAGGGTIRHSLERGNTKHEMSARRFAKKITAILDEAGRKGLYKTLVIAAEPRFLGMLREALPESVRKMVKHEIHREYAQGSDADIRKQVLKAVNEEKYLKVPQVEKYQNHTFKNPGAEVPLHVSFHNMRHSPAAYADVREKAALLEKFYPRISSIRVVIEPLAIRRHSGNQFRVSIDIKVPGGEIVVGHHLSPRMTAHEDVYVAIRDAFKAARRQLQDYVKVHFRPQKNRNVVSY